jgi:hypothetical protein
LTLTAPSPDEPPVISITLDDTHPSLNDRLTAIQCKAAIPKPGGKFDKNYILFLRETARNLF